MSRAVHVHAGVRIEIFTMIWMMVEAVVSIGEDIVAGSVLLTAFGLDSVIELVSAGVLLWRLSLEAREGDTERVEHAEHQAAWIVGIALALLCVYVLATSAYGLFTHVQPEISLVGIII